MHGTRDELVSVSHGLSMVARLRELQIHSTLHLYEGYMHHWPEIMHIAAVERMFDYILT
jgi:acetyl esterase/lipase